ncbi:putative Ig domain-containing protein [Larkinella rosea]|uniref:Dystroglycan-type cadherin-like domain-containing protein n=1 Tax=Larkinella rosea TaxID=2025312 RepID=A0A3P1BLV6_9BACT|nr:putative Ig domain-containing protein [Larkinella rosea]RRB02027.1 hypothetical protein EHT25_16155 [Larkinella rosea]
MKTSLLIFRSTDRAILLVGFLVLTSLSGFGQHIYYVTVGGGAVTKDGSSWTNAYAATQLQTAIDAASAFADGEVWVAGGLYKPTSGSDRTISFLMRDHVAIYGGFEGDETLLSERPPISLTTPSSTTLSGEIGGAGLSDNSYHVINNTSSALSNSAVLDGFVVTAGNANGAGELEFVGGGIANQNSSPTLRNCWFVGNSASKGGAIYNLAFTGTCSPVITNCVITQNTASFGGGMHNGVTGGGSASPKVTSCRFASNSATNSGAIDNEGGSPVVTNCSFTGNSATTNGGVSFNYTLQKFTNCTFLGNTASSGGVIHHTSGNTTFNNCVFWNNGGSSTFNNTIVVTANYCLFELAVTNYSGSNNQTTAVLPFISTTDLQLTACSPAINAGDPASTTTTSGTTDLAGNPRFFSGGLIDIGAYEFQGSAPTPPVIASSGGSSLTVTQGSPAVSLTITGCDGGMINWKGTGVDASTGTDWAISASTSAIGTTVYSVTCTLGGCASAPGSATVTVTSAVASGSYDGYIYGADCSSFRGWAWDRNKINTPISVDILDGDVVIATLLAGDFRQDLLQAGKGNGKHAFSFAIPDDLKNNLPHVLKARVNGSSFILKDSPKALICQNSTSPAGNKPPVAPSPTVLIAPLTAQENVPFSGTLVTFTDPDNDPLTYALIGLPSGLSLDGTSRVINGTPTESGTFLLTYTATDVPGATNSVSFNLTVLPEPSASVTGDFEGFLDKLDCGGIRGWVWDRKKVNTPLTVEFYLETSSPASTTVLGSSLANIYRVDLKNAGKGNGAHAYNFTPPAGLTNGTLVYARVLGSNYVLKGSPKAYQCAPARLSAEESNPLQARLLGNPVTDQVQVEIRGAENQPLRLTLTDATGRLIGERLLEKASAEERQTLPVSDRSSGLLLLRVTSGLRSVTLKALKP